MAAPKSLYIHIPFCVRKCLYCDFYSVPFSTNKDGTIERYLRACEEDLKRSLRSSHLETVYIGGGTPTVLQSHQLKKLLDIVARNVDVPELKEYTIEVNPGTVDKEKVALLKSYGITRVSVGVQSFNDDVLRFLGRIHTRNEALVTLDYLNEAGFRNVSIDIMHSIPGESIAVLDDDLRAACDANSEHISAYSLMVEPGTQLAGLVQNGTIALLYDEEQARMYLRTKEVLENHTFEHYEISNFAKNGNYSLHNLTYWNYKPYYGIGASAVSTVSGRRFEKTPDVNTYIEDILAGKDAVSYSERLTGKKQLGEMMMLGLRKIAGITQREVYEKTGYVISEVYAEVITRLSKLGLISFDKDTLKLSEKGLLVADTVMQEFLF